MEGSLDKSTETEYRRLTGQGDVWSRKAPHNDERKIL